MSSYVAAELRRSVAMRARRVCEYCLIHEEDTFFGCEVDHVISEKHGGPTVAENLAYACFNCNRQKGSDVGSISVRTGEFIRFFNPRSDRWADHFAFDDEIIQPLTDIGDVTARILDFNGGDRVLERRALRIIGRFPSNDAWIVSGMQDYP